MGVAGQNSCLLLKSSTWFPWDFKLRPSDVQSAGSVPDNVKAELKDEISSLPPKMKYAR
jgi:hypothetical protein